MTLIAHLYRLKKETFSGYTEDAIHLLLKRYQLYCRSSLIGFFFLFSFLWSFLFHKFPSSVFLICQWHIFLFSSSITKLPVLFSSLFNFSHISVDFGEEKEVTTQAQDKTFRRDSRGMTQSIGPCTLTFMLFTLIYSFKRLYNRC